MADTEARRADRIKDQDEEPDEGTDEHREEPETSLRGPSGQHVAEPASGDPERSDGEPAVERTPEENPPKAEDRQEVLSEEAEGSIAPPRSDYRNRSREELLDRASELGLNMDPSVDREVLVDKLSEAEAGAECRAGMQEDAGGSPRSRRAWS